MLKQTSLNQAHKNLGARMVDFGGWEMPVVYSNQIAEHKAVREQAGIFDVSHMGEIIVKGKDSLVLLQKVLSRDISKMTDGQVSLCVMCTPEGGIIDDLTVYKHDQDNYLLVVNAGTADGDYDWVKEHAHGLEVEVKNISDEVAKIDLQGPKAEEILQILTDFDLKEIKRYHFKIISVAGVEMTISRSGYTGEDGFELYLPNRDVEAVWNRLLEVGEPFGLLPCGLGARDTLRTECGMMLYGHDIDRDHTPLEAVYGWAVSLDKDFIGRDVLQNQKESGLKRKLVGFEMIGRGIARQHYPIYFQGKPVGEVTSGVPSPTLGKNIGMGYIEYELREPGTKIDIQVRDNMVEAEIVKLPFYKKD